MVTSWSPSAGEKEGSKLGCACPAGGEIHEILCLACPACSLSRGHTETGPHREGALPATPDTFTGFAPYPLPRSYSPGLEPKLSQDQQAWRKSFQWEVLWRRAEKGVGMASLDIQNSRIDEVLPAQDFVSMECEVCFLHIPRVPPNPTRL